jgi:hypothetical protein
MRGMYRAFQTSLCQPTLQAGWLPAAERGQATYPPLPGTKMFETLCRTHKINERLQNFSRNT